MRPPPPDDLEALLAHSTWVRSLARGLVHDANAADDLVQGTWVAALDRPPRPGSNLEGWLATVVRNLALRRRRSEARRTLHQRSAAKPEAQPSVEELHARGELQRDLVQAVLDLEEPYSSTILQRYFEGLPPRAIAARQGVPVNTVHSRLSRGLGLLRARLEPTHGPGTRGAPALLALVQENGWKASIGPGALAMGLKTKVGLAAVVVALVGWASWRALEGPGAVPVHSETLAQRSTELPPAARLEERLPAAQHSAPELLREAPLAIERVRTPSPAGDAPATVLGRLLLPDGSPAVGAVVTLERKQRDEPAPVAIDTSTWKDLETRADEEGRFELRFVAPRGPRRETFRLSAVLPGYVPLDHLILPIRCGVRLDTGVRSFRAAGWVVGRIVDAAGESRAEGWEVRLEEAGDGGRFRVLQGEGIDSATRLFRFDGVPEGEMTVWATHPMGAKTNEVEASVTPGEEVYVELQDSGPDLERRICVRLALSTLMSSVLLDPQRGFVESGRLLLYGPTGGVHSPTPVPGSRELFVFDDLNDGLYRLEIEDPRFVPWRRDGLRPGDRVEVPLLGNASLRLLLIDVETSELVQGGELWCELEHSRITRPRFDLPEGEAQDDGSLIIRGLLPGTFTVFARTSVHPRASVRVEELGAGEERTVVISLARTPALAGRVVHSDGVTPARDVDVERTDGGRPGHRTEGMLRVNGEIMPPVDESQRTDGEGRFLFEGVPAMEQSLRACWGRWTSATRHLRWPEDAGEEVVLVLPPSGWLQGRILLPESSDISELRLLLEFEDQPEHSRLGHISEESVSGGELERDGSFRLGPLPTGNIDLKYYCGGGSVPPYFVSSGELGSVTILPGETTQVEFDLREAFPGLLRVRVRIAGRPPNSGIVMVRDSEAGMGRQLDANGELITYAKPGDCSIRYRAADDRWSFGLPYPAAVHPGQTTVVDLELLLHEKRVVFVDPTSGSALSDTRVTWLMGHSPKSVSLQGLCGGSALTDSDGALTLVLPEEEIRFWWGEAPQFAYEPHADVFWAGGDGESIVPLPRR